MSDEHRDPPKAPPASFLPPYRADGMWTLPPGLGWRADDPEGIDAPPRTQHYDVREREDYVRRPILRDLVPLWERLAGCVVAAILCGLAGVLLVRLVQWLF